MKRSNLFFVVVALFWFGQFIYVPFLSPYMRAAGISGTVIGVIAGAYGVTQMALRVPLSIGGWKSGSHKAIIAGGLAAVFVSCIIPMFSESWIAFLLTRALSGVASASWISYSAYMLEGAGDNANKRMGHLMAANTGGICVSQLIGTLIYGHVGMRAMFAIGAASAVAALALLAATPMSKTRAPGEVRVLKKSAYIAVLRNKTLWLCALLMAVSQVLHFSANLSFAGVFAQESLGATSFQLGLIVFVGQLAAMATSMSFGRIQKASGFSERTVLVFGFALFAAYCVVLPNLATATAACFIQIIAGVAGSIVGIILFANAGRDFSDDQQILSMGLFQTIYSIGITGGPVLTGAVLDAAHANYRPPFYMLAGFGLLGAACAAALYRAKGQR
ncbi:MAG: MFS transporter [Clostridiales Family XIII bacterium]|nr:MFS transporter [Clostridiales Family XIII bacterium]